MGILIPVFGVKLHCWFDPISHPNLFHLQTFSLLILHHPTLFFLLHSIQLLYYYYYYLEIPNKEKKDVRHWNVIQTLSHETRLMKHRNISKLTYLGVHNVPPSGGSVFKFFGGFDMLFWSFEVAVVGHWSSRLADWVSNVKSSSLCFPKHFNAVNYGKPGK